MMILTIDNAMLYCPKCQKTYEEGSQRFCSDEAVRLLPASSSERAATRTNGVFSKILNRKSRNESGKFSSVPRFSQLQSRISARSNTQPPSEIFKNESEFELKLELEPLPKSDLKPSAVELRNQSFELDEISLNPETARAKKIVSSGAKTFNFDAPKNLLGRTFKDRYRITELISADKTRVVYLAEDVTAADKKVALKLLSGADDSFIKKILAEERTSLARINHPNIANILDSAETLAGNAYIIAEYVESVTVKDCLEKDGRFDALRAARIIRQASDALGEAHQNGVLHRNLKLDNIVLFVDENGVERVKLTGFGAAPEQLNERNLPYKSPEQVEGKIADFTGDNYSLAVIAYQMLTNRMPFNASSVGDLLKAQREGVRIRPSDARFDLPSSIDDILKKALSFNSFDRYSNVRDFGDEFFGEMIADSSSDAEGRVETFLNEPAKGKTVSAPVLLNEGKVAPEITLSADDYEYLPEIRETNDAASIKAAANLVRRESSPERSSRPDSPRNLFSVFGIAVLLAALLGAWYYFIDRQNQTLAPVKNTDQKASTAGNSSSAANLAAAAPSPERVEALPPQSRAIAQPTDSVYFENDVNNLNGVAAENFLGFSLYYPKDWVRKDAANNFLDVSRVAENGLPIEQMLVSYYESDGTYDADSRKFPSLVEDTNATLKKIVPNYKLISEGETTVNNGWRAYEVKFQGAGEAVVGEKITLWGRRLFIPPATLEVKSGYVLTMLATSLSKDVKSAEDVGVRGELSTVLETFEPSQNF